MACVERGSFVVYTWSYHTVPRGGGKFKSGGGVGSLFVKDKRVDHTKSCEIQWIYKKTQKLHRIRMRNSTIDERI